ncbi:MAG: glyoxylate/hydroxypyruvate reductase A [Rhodobacteraceae bacterium]|nr:glyoxylate/hydroxypyruvate reductase A [Paracoccaceae bacterium]
MPAKVLFAGRPAIWPVYRETLAAAFDRKGIRAELFDRCDDPATVDYIVYSPNQALTDFRPFTRLKAVLSLWAGVETIQTNQTLTAPLARMVDAGLTDGMAEWVLGHVMRYHLGIDRHLFGQDGIWRGADPVPPLARDRAVGILGLGTLGLASARLLQAVGFQVSGWSRRPKTASGIRGFSGREGLHQILSSSEILVLLLPQTAATKNILDTETLGMLPEGAVIINPGRGALIDDQALLASLDSGQIGHATLDVFRQEPLPADHPFWTHPRVTVTPHIASETRPETASDCIAENIRRGQAGEPFLHLVDRGEGY